MFFRELQENLENYLTQKKFIVDEASLCSMLKTCLKCGVEGKVFLQRQLGSMAIFRSICGRCRSEREWASQQYLHGMPSGNLSICAGIFFSGASPTQCLRLLNFCEIYSPCIRTFQMMQKYYFVPAVYQVWKDVQQKLLAEARDRGKPLCLGGDARCCSPGHTAKYGSYTLMDLDTGKILSMQIVQVV